MDQKYGTPPVEISEEEIAKIVDEAVGDDPTITLRKKHELRFRTGIVADRWLRGKLADAGCDIDSLERISFGFAQMCAHVPNIWDTARTVLADWVERKFIEPPGKLLADKLIEKYGFPEDILSTFTELMARFGVEKLDKESLAMLKKKLAERVEKLEPK